jgi:hypothetical protein
LLKFAVLPLSDSINVAPAPGAEALISLHAPPPPQADEIGASLSAPPFTFFPVRPDTSAYHSHFVQVVFGPNEHRQVARR